MLDGVIGEIAPQAQYRRAVARAKTATVMNYDAAGRGARTYGWKAPATDADAASLAGRARLRQLSRDMIRNRPYAARARDVIVANVVGTGIAWSVQHDDPDLRDQITARLQDFLETPAFDARGECDLAEMQAIVMAAVVSDGEVLARRRIKKGAYGRKLPVSFQVELIECDHLDTARQSNGQNEIIDGVEYGPTGEIEAYWLFPQHPGSASPKRQLDSERVSWRDIIHVRRFDRPGQLRGVPWLAPVMMTLAELSEYQESEIIKQRMAALLAGVVSYDEAETDAKEQAGGLEDLRPGALVVAPAGASAVTWTNPPRVDSYDRFMGEGLGAVAMGLGLSREALSGDMSRVNFSSGRMGRMEMDRNIEMWQRHLMIGQFCEGVARWIQEAWRLLPDRSLAEAEFRLQWTAPRRPMIDPVKEVAAILDAVDGGLMSLQRGQRMLGLDPATIRREREEDGLPAGASFAGPRRTADLKLNDDETDVTGGNTA